MLAKALPSLREPARVALVLRSGGPLYQAVHGGRITFCYVDLALPPDAIAERLQAFAPTVLAAPPQVLDDLAARRSSVSRPDLAPHTIYSIADVLDDDVAARVASGFGCPARQIYQATEGFLGISCEHGTLHLNEDLVHVEREVIDQSSGRFTPVITDLYRTTQAIIRYRLNDVLLPGVPDCPCGSAFATVARVEGRADDVLWLPDQAGATRPCSPTSCATRCWPRRGCTTFAWCSAWTAAWGWRYGPRTRRPRRIGRCNACCARAGSPSRPSVAGRGRWNRASTSDVECAANGDRGWRQAKDLGPGLRHRNPGRPADAMSRSGPRGAHPPGAQRPPSRTANDVLC